LTDCTASDDTLLSLAVTVELKVSTSVLNPVDAGTAPCPRSVLAVWLFQVPKFVVPLSIEKSMVLLTPCMGRERRFDPLFDRKIS